MEPRGAPLSASTSEREVAVTPRERMSEAALRTMLARLSVAISCPLDYDGHHSAYWRGTMTTIIITKETPMPMIDVYAVEGTFDDKHALAKDLAAAVMRWE